MDDIEKIQNDILDLAYETFSCIKAEEWFSFPLIPRISNEYFNNRMVVLGQETNSWLGHFQNSEQRQVYDDCLNGYDSFVKDKVLSYRGKFWAFSRNLYKDVLNGNICENGRLSHCWMNLFCVEQCPRNGKTKKGKPSQDRKLAEQVIAIQKDFVYQVMKLIRPRVILALIGNRNDDIFAKYALGVDYGCIDRSPLNFAFGEKQLAKFKVQDKSNPLHETLIIRAYHPSYFMGRMKGDKSSYQKLIYQTVKDFLK